MPAAPDCNGKNNSGVFYAPQTTTLRQGQQVEISWGIGRFGSSSVWSAYCVPSQFEPSRKQTTIFRRQAFFYEWGPRHSEGWEYIDDCGNVQLFYNWTVPDLYSDGGLFYIALVNATDGKDLDGAGPTAPSIKGLSFTIPAAESTTTSSVLSTLPGSPTETPSAGTNTPTLSPNSVPNTGLSTGTKAGIAVGTIVGVLLMLAGALQWRQRHRGGPLSAAEPETSIEKTRFEKPELDSETKHRSPPTELFTPPSEEPSELPEKWNLNPQDIGRRETPGERPTQASQEPVELP